MGGVYCLLSDGEVQVNAAFVYLRNLTCPQVNGRAVDNCFEHEGTYFGSLAIRVQGDHWLRVEGGGLQQSFESVTVDDQLTVQVGDTYNSSSSRVPLPAPIDTTAATARPGAVTQLTKLRQLLRRDTTDPATATTTSPTPQLSVTRRRVVSWWCMPGNTC